MPEWDAMPSAKPRRTADRILDVTLELYNRFGEPNVSTTLISTELGISPGNLYYHYPAKDELANALYDRFDARLTELLRAADEVHHVEDAWLFVHMLFELIWDYRFLYRDLNDLLSRNRKLEMRFQFVLKNKAHALRTMLRGLTAGQTPQQVKADADTLANAMLVVLTYWLSFEYVRDPRNALEPAHAGAALARGAFHVLSLLSPHLPADERAHLAALAQPYLDA